jgi:hypothetical protein
MMYYEKTKTLTGGILYDVFSGEGDFIRSFLSLKTARTLLGKIKKGERLRGPYWRGKK